MNSKNIKMTFGESLLNTKLIDMIPELRKMKTDYEKQLTKELIQPMAKIHILENKIKDQKDLNPYFNGINIPKNLLKNKIKFNLLVYGVENPYCIGRSWMR